MKQLGLLFGFLFLVVLGVQAQTTRETSVKYALVSETNSTNGDTLVNSVAKGQKLALGKFWDVVVVTCNLTSTGTPGGSVQPQVTTDGVKYYNLPGATPYTIASAANQGCHFQINNWGYLGVRFLITTTGSHSTIVSSSVLARRR